MLIYRPILPLSFRVKSHVHIIIHFSVSNEVASREAELIELRLNLASEAICTMQSTITDDTTRKKYSDHMGLFHGVYSTGMRLQRADWVWAQPIGGGVITHYVTPPLIGRVYIQYDP